MSGRRIIRGAAAGLALALAPGLAAAEPRQYDTVFAEAATARYDLQVAGTYPARDEVLLKLPNGNQYAVPVAPGSDLSVWRENELVRLDVTQGLVVALEPAGSAEPGYSYTVVNDTAVMDGIPDDVLVRRIEIVAPVEEVDVEAATITFEAPVGETRTAPVVEASLVETIESGALVDFTYFDAVEVTRR